MNKKYIRNFWITGCVFLLFVLYTLAVMFIDVQLIGPNDSSVGFATINGAFHDLTGVHMKIYQWGDWLSVIPAAIVGGFGILGLVQLIKRKSLWKVDLSILTLGGFYVVVLISYLFFEHFVVNYRPVIIEGVLEASYPSSTTMLVICVMVTANLQFKRLIKDKNLLRIVLIVSRVYLAFMVLGRLISGVHWITDIIGGSILSLTLVMLYCTTTNWLTTKIKEKISKNKR
ncbi:MAG: phosphatase PAP2 family protein [Clostridiales bacterium]|nr:phosphatase PAP2 family protein [Clostridiales bacterium]